MSPPHAEFTLRLPDRTLPLGPDPLVMGILNVTPDSFSDGGDHPAPDAALAHARHLIADGADIIDIGGESTRPGAEPVGAQAEMDRVLPVLDALRATDCAMPLSIDTSKAIVADQAVQHGATLINDVWGLQRDPEIADVAALYDLPIVAMHWDPDRDPDADLIAALLTWFERTLAIADRAGIKRDQIVLDPGFGFAKSLAENYQLLRRLDELHVLGFPLLVGTSRKSMFGKLLDVPPKDRVVATAASSTLAYARGAHIFRVHDVGANRDALRVAAATLYGPPHQGETTNV